MHLLSVLLVDGQRNTDISLGLLPPPKHTHGEHHAQTHLGHSTLARINIQNFHVCIYDCEMRERRTATRADVPVRTQATASDH